MDRRALPLIALAVASSAFLAWAFAPGLLGLGRYEGTWERMQAGSGYEEVDLDTFAGRVKASTVAPDGSRVAILFTNGSAKLWTRDNTSTTGWAPRDVPQDLHGCRFSSSYGGIRLMQNGSVVLWAYDLCIYNETGALVWSHKANNASVGILDVVVLGNGSSLLVAYGNQELEFFDMAAGLSRSYPSLDPPIVAGSGNGEILAGSYIVVRFFDSTGKVIAEVPRNADVQVSADGRVAVVGDGTGELEGTLVVLDLSNGTVAQREIRVPNMADIRGHYPHEPNRIFMSPSGRFVAVKAEEWLSACGGFDCVVGGASYVRVVDLQDPSRNLGFGSLWQNEIAVLDDGSAVGIQGFTTTYGPWKVRLVVAEAGSTPPQKILERTGTFYDRSDPQVNVGVGMGLFGLSVAVLAMALSRRRLNPPGPRA